MSRKNKQQSCTSLGRALIKDRFGGMKGRKNRDVSMLHTTELDDGYDWGRLNLQSVTEESSFQEFLSTAELAASDFETEKLNITFVNPLANIGLLSKEEKDAIEKSHLEHKADLRIPRRPQWSPETTREELDASEKESFLEWRRRLALLQEKEGLILTPYERNLEFWRQLWRVVERSDVIVQIVDARNPLLFRSADLEVYVKEVSEHKQNLILLNKADFLTEVQRQCWADYFASISVHIAFFSAILVDNEDSNVHSGKEAMPVATHEDDHVSNKEDNGKRNDESISQSSMQTLDSEIITSGEKSSESGLHFANSSELLSRKHLIEFLKSCHKGPKTTGNVTTVGLVGYPNVGKSSTINALLDEKKVSVSATPGKTKHFQTLYLDSDLLLCDCPGLVMPSFVSTRAEMILNGILPIDHLRDYMQPINLLSSLIPRHTLEDTYGIMLPAPLEEEDPTRPPTPQELLSVFGYNRGYMTHKGIPDYGRSSRTILKDFVIGKLLYCSAPPNIDQQVYHQFPLKQSQSRQRKSQITPQEKKILRPNKTTTDDIDQHFFEKANIGKHVKGRQLVKSGITATTEEPTSSKPWKKNNKTPKREKLRRLYGHLDA